MLVEKGGHVLGKDLAHSVAEGLVVFVICGAMTGIEHDRFLPLTVEETGEPLADQHFGFRHDAVDQFLAGRNVVDEARNHAA